MSVKAAIYNRLSNFSALTSLVSTRIYPGIAPQNTAIPYVTYQQISNESISAMGADTGLERPRFQVDSWSTSPLEADNVAIQVKSALQRYEGTLEGTTIQVIFLENDVDIYDHEAGIHHVSTDFEINHGGV